MSKFYRKLVTKLQNDFTKENIKYPKSVVKAYNLLEHHRRDQVPVTQYRGDKGINFANIKGIKGEE